MMTRTMPNDHKFGNKWRAGKKPANAFAKGHDPWNKGLKGIHLSPDTEFKPGEISPTRVAVGTVTIRTDKNGNPRAWVKIANPSSWKERAVLNWEREHGPVPNGMVIHHRDRNTTNDAIDNLQAMTRAEHILEHKTDLLDGKKSAL